MNDFAFEAEQLMVKLFNTYEIISKKKVEYVPGIQLYPSEVHTLDAIGANAGTNLTTLAKILGVTRGALSKIAVKQEKQGFIRRYRYLNNQKDIFLQLTASGEAVFAGHKKYHEKREARLYKKYNDIPDEKALTILQFLRDYYNELEILLKSGSGNNLDIEETDDKSKKEE